ncbi:MAG: alpha/beta fold hydrolase [Candidatus Doudnabacteria bacterium]|nr:alpha/beta fold hydrolase [Candidatus Doudnabacteria bacterium]
MNPVELIIIPYAIRDISARVCAPDSPSQKWVLFLNGAGAALSKDRFLGMQQELAKAGYNSLSFDYIGTGATGGDLYTTSLENRIEQCLVAVLWLQEQYGPIGELSIYGVSMGGYAALGLAAYLQSHGPVQPRAVILAAGAAYAPEAHAVLFGPQFTSILRSDIGGKPSWNDSLSFEWLRTSVADVLLIVAENDEVVPAELSAQYKAAGEQKVQGRFEYLLLPGCTHYIGQTGEEGKLASTILTFLKQ